MVGRLRKAEQHFHVALELFREFLVLLVAPRGIQRIELVGLRRGPLAKLLVEPLQALRELAQFFGIDDSLRHECASKGQES